jgi:hypothetical protein
MRPTAQCAGAEMRLSVFAMVFDTITTRSPSTDIRIRARLRAHILPRLNTADIHAMLRMSIWHVHPLILSSPCSY